MRKLLKKIHLRQIALLFSILTLAAALRFVGVDWDQGQHLHPDERFLTMVGNAMRIPDSFNQYMDPKVSPMNPANINFGFFVYGVLPVTLNKMLTVLLDADSYQGFTQIGRMLSAFTDLLAVLLVYKIVQLFEKKQSVESSVKYFAAFFYAIAVIPIQLSHFFAVDTFLNTFLLASFYFSLRYWATGSLSSFFLSTVTFSLAIASKVNGMLMVPLIGGFLITGLFLREKGEWVKNRHRLIVTGKKLFFAFLIALAGLAVSYLTLRVSNPYLFESKNLLDPTVSNLFLDNVRTLKSWDNPDVWFPPGVQWIDKPPITFALFNLAFFGIGVSYFIICIIGMITIFRNKKLQPLGFALLWAMLFFLYQSTQFVKNARYFIIIYPFLAIAAGTGFQFIYRRSGIVLSILLGITMLVWPLAFVSIYMRDHSRVEASKWIYQHLPAGSTIAHEHWDDALPVPLPASAGQYSGKELPVFDPDSPQKWQTINSILQTTDYYILSSNRAWGSIMAVPKRYPLGSKFYRELFAGKRGFKKVTEITSYPSLRYLGIPLDIPDDAAEESFTVYDHPKVLIFERVK